MQERFELPSAAFQSEIQLMKAIRVSTGDSVPATMANPSLEQQMWNHAEEDWAMHRSKATNAAGTSSARDIPGYKALIDAELEIVRNWRSGAEF